MRRLLPLLIAVACFCWLAGSSTPTSSHPDNPLHIGAASSPGAAVYSDDFDNDDDPIDGLPPLICVIPAYATHYPDFSFVHNTAGVSGRLPASPWRSLSFERGPPSNNI